MRSFLTYGFISLATVASLYACGDDSGDGDGVAGSGGSTAGNGGSGGATGGNGGSGGATGGAGGATAGAGGAPGPGPAPTATCTGCVQLSVQVPATPVTATGSQAGYIFTAPATAAAFDLTNVTSITWRIQVLTPGATYFVQPFVQNAPPESPTYLGSYPAAVPLLAADFPAGMFADVVMDIAGIGAPVGGDAGADAGEPPVVADAGDAGAVGPLTVFDKSLVRQIGLNVGAGATGPAGWVSVAVDSVTVAGTSNFTTKNFATDVEGLSLNMFQVPPGTLPPTFR